MISNHLLLEFAMSGGRPPERNEFLRIHQDGTTTCLVGNAWPEGEPQNEAGLYQANVQWSQLESVKAFVLEHKLFEMDEEYGPRHPDSGFNFLRLFSAGREKTITWGHFASVPDAIIELGGRLRSTIQDTRKHPEQTVTAILSASPKQVDVGDPFEIELKIHNRGRRAARVRMPGPSETRRLRIYAAKSEESADEVPPLGYYLRAQRVALPELGAMRPGVAFELSPGEEKISRGVAPDILSRPGNYRLYGFAEPTMELTLDGKPLTLECFLVIQTTITAKKGQASTNNALP